LANPSYLTEIIGGILLLIAGPLLLLTFMMNTSFFSGTGIVWSDYGASSMPYLVNAGLTFLWGILAIVGAILGKKGSSAGHVLCLIVGIIAVVGLFIPLAAASTITVGGQSFELGATTLSGSFIYVDPFLVLIGGIIGVATRELEFS
jgi:hypothetical protein